MPKIYESPDKGKTVYEREFGSSKRTKVIDYTEIDPDKREWEYAGDGTKIYKPEAGKPTPTEYEKK